MGYRNAQDIFPEGLLRQIQRYVAGETIYIPAGDEGKPGVKHPDTNAISGKETGRSARVLPPERRSRS